MPYTFGAGTGDDITFSGVSSFFGGSSSALVAGWFRPTTLTAGRTLWSFGNAANCAVIGATTSELEILTDNVTTDGKWTTSGLGLTVNEWRFLAVWGSFTDTGPAATIRVWAGAINSAPVEITVVATTAPVGNFTVSAQITSGNKGTGVLAFQGDIANIVALTGTQLTLPTLVVPAAHGTITQDEADLFQQVYINPLWHGDIAVILERGRGPTNSTQTARWFLELNGSLVTGRSQTAITPEFAANSVNGATVSQNGCPRPPISRPSWPLRRR